MVINCFNNSSFVLKAIKAKKNKITGIKNQYINNKSQKTSIFSKDSSKITNKLIVYKVVK